MARKNSNVRRSNDRRRLARQAAEALPRVKVGQSRLRVDELIIPDGRCEDHGWKPRPYFNTEAKAAKVLEQAQRQRAGIGSGHVEKRYYECPTHPGERWHLTSREEYRSWPSS